MGQTPKKGWKSCHDGDIPPYSTNVHLWVRESDSKGIQSHTNSMQVGSLTAKTENVHGFTFSWHVTTDGGRSVLDVPNMEEPIFWMELIDAPVTNK